MPHIPRQPTTIATRSHDLGHGRGVGKFFDGGEGEEVRCEEGGVTTEVEGEEEEEGEGGGVGDGEGENREG